MDELNIGIYEKALPEHIAWGERFRAAREAGYRFLELSIDETEQRQSRLEWSLEKILELRKIALKTGMNIRTMCLSAQRKFPLGSTDEKTEKRALDIMRTAIDFAAVMGISIIQIAGYDVYYEPSSEKTREKFFINLQKSVEMASQKGVVLALETMENDFMNTIEKAMQYVNIIQSPYLKVYPDMGNVSNGASNIIDDINKGKGNIVAAHLKETKPGVYREVPYGAGNVDFVSAIRHLRKQGVNMFLAEFWYNDEKNWRKTIEEARIFLEDAYKSAMSC